MNNERSVDWYLHFKAYKIEYRFLGKYDTLNRDVPEAECLILEMHRKWITLKGQG